DRDSWPQTEPRGPRLAERPSEAVGSGVAPTHPRADTRQERIDAGEEIVARQAAERFVPHPLMAHGTDTARKRAGIVDAAEEGRPLATWFQGGDEAGPQLGVAAQPVQQLGEADLR